MHTAHIKIIITPSVTNQRVLSMLWLMFSPGLWTTQPPGNKTAKKATNSSTEKWKKHVLFNLSTQT